MRRILKWPRGLGITIAVVIASLAALVIWSEQDEQVPTSRIKNQTLPVIKQGWAGNPVDRKNRFINDEFPFLPKLTDLLKWQLGGNKFKEEKRSDTWRPDVHDASEFLSSTRDGILWLGHASFLIRVNGVSILTDPLFGDASFVTRLVAVSSPLDKISDVSFVLLSHDHRDHTDETTLRGIAEKFPHSKFIAGLRSEDNLNEWKTPSNEVLTAGWFQELNTGDDRVRIFFLPVRHWSRRGLFDTNWRLWGAYVVQTPNTTIYFSGDSGYGRHYREAAELFPRIDYFLIGIGAYEPRWFMEPNHNDPSDALRAFHDARARFLIPMHYGTFDLSDEPPGRPLDLSATDKSGKMGAAKL
ncbi:MAG: MBL fold metallo-hydrolase [Acidobacteria bacterium]|nr:MBL fold metallo-hydrolase [Acidobacteriota bacterium]